MRYLIVSSMIIFISMISCKYSTDPIPASSPTIIGTVVDSDGLPIEGAIIEIGYNLSLINTNNLEFLVKSSETNTMNVIYFPVHQTGNVKLWIARYGCSDTVKILIDKELFPGYYSETWTSTNADNQLVISNIYTFHIEAPTYSTAQNMLIKHDYNKFDEIDNLEYIARTDSYGNFSIKENELAYHHKVTFSSTDEQGIPLGESHLSRYINVWSLHNNLKTCYIDSIFIDSESDTKIDLVMYEK